MKTILMSMILIWILTMMIMLIAFTLSKKTSYDREKNTPFECGFDPKGKSRIPFSMRFFIIAVIFLIFDVEIALILPLIMILSISNFKMWLSITIYFMVILLMGLYYEWKFGALNWLS